MLCPRILASRHRNNFSSTYIVFFSLYRYVCATHFPWTINVSSYIILTVLVSYPINSPHRNYQLHTQKNCANSCVPNSKILCYVSGNRQQNNTCLLDNKFLYCVTGMVLLLNFVWSWLLPDLLYKAVCVFLRYVENHVSETLCLM